MSTSARTRPTQLRLPGICPNIETYVIGQTAHGGDFDIADIKLSSPAAGVTVTLPVPFTWQKRPVASDTYRLVLWDPETGGSGGPLIWGMLITLPPTACRKTSSTVRNTVGFGWLSTALTAVASHSASERSPSRQAGRQTSSTQPPWLPSGIAARPNRQATVAEVCEALA